MKVLGLDIRWLGHASFLIKGTKTIYIDPFVLTGDTPEADIILITHDHFDHCDPEKVNQIKKEGTEIVSTTAGIRKLGSPENAKSLSNGQSTEVLGIRIKAVPAYNVNKFRSPGVPFHPKGEGNGYIFEIDGLKVYHAGDTDFIPEMKDLAAEKIDIALLPAGGTYTMDESEVIEAAKAINPRKVVPMHYGTLDATVADPQRLKNNLESQSNIEVVILG